MTQSKEYAELIWPIDVLITLVWVVFAINFFGTIAIRKVQHLYVAIWFYMSFVITIAVLHIVNSLAIPATLFRSYPIYSRAHRRLVQWWYGHNAVGFFLTTPFLGLMYYFLPKAAERPVYSYRLSILHFWGLVFLYIWAGPHHLLYSALPDWAQTLGMVFSIVLLAPSWGGMLNGLLTLRGARGTAPHRPHPEVHGGGRVVLRHEHLRGSHDVHPIRERIGPLHQLGHRPRPYGRPRMGGHDVLRDPLLDGPELLEQGPRPSENGDSPFLARHHRHRSLHGVDVGRGPHGGPPVAGRNDTGQLANPIFLDIVHRLMPYYWIRFLGGMLYLTGMVNVPLQPPEDHQGIGLSDLGRGRCSGRRGVGEDDHDQ